MMKFAAGIKCTNPNCSGGLYDALIEDGYHAECPRCGQVNRVAGQVLSNSIDGLCQRCGKPIDDLHIFGREPGNFCCPPGGKK